MAGSMMRPTITLLALTFAWSGSAQERLGPPPVDEVGVYFQKNGTWIDVPPEVINWKTGGVLRTIGTIGIVKENINGRIVGKGSKTRNLNQPVELLVYSHEGTAITEYQLLRLHTHSNSREFRTVTGGVFHVSGGSEGDTLEFESKHIAQRTWTITFEESQVRRVRPHATGGLRESRSPSAQLGKIYTFSIAE
jgi:hypothetical protein